MPRPPRPQLAGGLAHITSRGVRRLLIFIDDPDYLQFLRLLRFVQRRYGWSCLGYCLMGNHFHLLIETPQANLSAGMQWLNSRYAEYFNARHRHTGHLFERRFTDVVVRDDRHFVTLVRYIVSNPVRAGLCERVDQWPWSSYAESTGAASPRNTVPDRLWRYFGRPSRAAKESVAVFLQTDASPPDSAGV